MLNTHVSNGDKYINVTEYDDGQRQHQTENKQKCDVALSVYTLLLPIHRATENFNSTFRLLKIISVDFGFVTLPDIRCFTDISAPAEKRWTCNGNGVHPYQNYAVPCTAIGKLL